MIISLYTYAVFTHDGECIAENLEWNDVLDLTDLLEVDNDQLVIMTDHGASKEDQLITLPFTDDEEQDVARMWGKVRMMGREYRKENVFDAVMSKPLEVMLMIDNVPKSPTAIIKNALTATKRSLVNYMMNRL